MLNINSRSATSATESRRRNGTLGKWSGHSPSERRERSMAFADYDEAWKDIGHHSPSRAECLAQKAEVVTAVGCNVHPNAEHPT